MSASQSPSPQPTNPTNSQPPKPTTHVNACRMVRVLVSTVVREATPGAGVVPSDAGDAGDADDAGDAALVVLAERRERYATGINAPALGLCFAAVGGTHYYNGGDEGGEGLGG